MDDCGGGYSESIAEMCDELQNGDSLLPLLIATPNGRDEAGTSRDDKDDIEAADYSLQLRIHKKVNDIRHALQAARPHTNLVTKVFEENTAAIAGGLTVSRVLANAEMFTEKYFSLTHFPGKLSAKPKYIGLS